MPDVQQWQPAPGPTLAVAATLADLRVGTWVYSSPLRMPWSMAWEAHSLSVLTEGRFEMGIGTGRPGIEDELRELGLPVVTPGERLSQVRDTVTSLRELDGPDLQRTLLLSSVTRPEPGPIRSFAAGDTVLTIAPAGRRRQGTRLERMLAYTSPDSEPAIMGAVDDTHYSLVIAAAQAAGPCPVGEEAAWGRRVHGLTVDLHLIAQQARQDIERLESARTFIAFLEKVEIEESSRRGLLTLRLPSGESEPIRTEQMDTDRGRATIERARSLEGRWVLVYRYNERKTGQRNQSVRMLAHLMDLGGDGAVPSTAAKKMVLQEAGGDVTRAQQAWTVAGLPGNGPVSVDQLEHARLAAREAG